MRVDLPRAGVLLAAGAVESARHRPPSASRWSAVTRAPRGDPRGGGRGGAGLRRRRRAPRRRAADARGGLPHRRARRRPRRDALGQPQPDAGQRHQVLQPAAGTSCPTTSRTRSRPSLRDPGGRRPTGAEVGRVSDDARRPGAGYLDFLLTTVPNRLRRAARRRRLRERRRGRGRPDGCCAAPAPRCTRIGATPDGLNINDGCGSTHMENAGRRGARARRRRRASPTTVTPTGAWPSTRTARSSTATRSWRSARWRCASAASSSTTPSSPR